MTALLRQRAVQAAAIGIAAWLAALGLSKLGVIERVELASWDWRVQQLAEPAPTTDEIRMVELDQASLDWGLDANSLSWPWPRQAYVPFLEFMRRAGAKAVLFDVLYTEPSSHGVADDRQFARALRDGPPTVLAMMLGRGRAVSELDWQSGLNPPDAYLRPVPALTDSRAIVPLTSLREAASAVGHVNGAPDRDSVFRHGAPVRYLGDTAVPMLGLAGILAAGERHRLPERPPFREDGTLVLNYRGPTDVYEPTSLRDVIRSELLMRRGDEPAVPPERFAGKYVFLGFTAPGLHDLGPTPFEQAAPRVGVHATMLDNLLAGDFIERVPAAATWSYALVLALLAAATARYGVRLRTAVPAAAAVVATPVVASGAAYEAGYWLPMMGPGIAAGIALAATYAVSYAVEGRQRRFVRHAFQQYLSPQVIDSLMAHPERLSLGGETRELTIMFSDVAGFTSLSEGLDPQTLTALLNDYLSAMSEIILEEGGTIDKYEGDAIICFWNAPLDLADHPARAVRAVLRCRQALADSQADWVARYGHPVRARFGVNTGPVVVGNLGSRQRFDYTFLGDAGNLAARLEGVNKVFGTGALVSGATWERLEGAFAGRRVGRVQVVGRDESVTVYEPLDSDDAERRGETLAAFEEALALLESGSVEQAAPVFQRLADDDPVSAAYRDALDEPGSGDWDGIWRLTEK